MAAAREQINPKVAGTTKALLLRYCQEKHTTQGDVVDAALLAFLQPQADDDLSVVQMGLLRSLAERLQSIEEKQERLQMIEAKQDSLEQGVAALVPLLTTIVEKLEPPPEPQEPPVPIARYAQIYPELRARDTEAQEEPGESGASEHGTPPRASAPLAQDRLPLPRERRGWFFARRTAP